MAKKNWDLTGNGGKVPGVDVDRAWDKVYNRLKKDRLIPEEKLQVPARPVIPGILRLAAAALIVLAAGTAFYLVTAKTERMTARALDQQEFGLTLPDGSGIDMNAGTKLEYRQLKSGIRLVRLEGEAWFDVKHLDDRPFVIRAGNGTVEVTGTSFSVRTLPDSNRIEVYVEAGNVTFYRTRKKNHFLDLKSGQMGVLENNRLSRITRMGPNHNSWKTRKLIFRDTPLRDVAGVLNRTYNQEIQFSDESLEDCLFTGTFDQQPMDSVVRVIQLAFGLELDREERAYVFTGNGCH